MGANITLLWDGRVLDRKAVHIDFLEQKMDDIESQKTSVSQKPTDVFFLYMGGWIRNLEHQYK
ncbi:hypothetical protein R4Z09_03180 [Niallia oryzisoli]|uniref:Uncharacterized protein n=1 Tax=Niallia oryzisoli TaxID=1737571 RepID=A0ABZ2CE30_9BACI